MLPIFTSLTKIGTDDLQTKPHKSSDQPTGSQKGSFLKASCAHKTPLLVKNC